MQLGSLDKILISSPGISSYSNAFSENMIDDIYILNTFTYI